MVDWNDVKILHDQWLTNPTGLNPSADLNDDNDVNFVDFAIIANDRGDSAAFKGNQLTMTFDPGTLNYETTYYWRVDQINTQGRTIGDLWRFTTRPDTGLDPDLVAWWQLENNAIDSAGPNNGTVYGAVATTGKIDLALSFDEIDDYVSAPDFDYTNASDEFTLSFWFKIDDVAGSSYQYMFSHGNYAATNSINVYFSETDEGSGGEEVRTQIVLSDNTTWYGVTPGIYADGAWHLYANDTHPGTEALPWETLKKATLTVVAGDTIYVKEGVYIDTVNSFERKFKPTNSGTAANPITFISSPRHAAVVRSDSLPGSRQNFAWGISWSIDYIVIDGFKIEGGLVLGYGGGDHCIVRNCEVIYGRCPDSDGSLNWGISTHDADYCTIENNYVHDMTDSGNNAHNTACIMIFGNSDYNIIQSNTADASNGIIYNAFGQKGGQMDNNIWRYNLALNATAGYLGMGSTDNTQFSDDNTYYQNVAVNCNYFIELDHNCRRFILYNNTAVDCDKFLGAGRNSNIDTQMWNNILVGTNYRAIWWGGYPDALPFSNLIDYSNYNCFYNNAVIGFREKSPSIYYYTLEDWQSGTGFDANSTVEDPCLMGGGDYRLKCGSVCIDAGIDLQDYDSDLDTTERIDMGAYITGSEIIGHDWADPPSAPAQASAPNPSDTAGDISINADLSWTPGEGAVSHNVYFGTDLGEVTTAMQPLGDVDNDGLVDWNDVNVLGQQWLSDPQCLSPSADLNNDNNVNFLDLTIVANDWTEDISALFMGNQSDTAFDPGSMSYETTYYWRIDEINAQGTTIGTPWSFTTRVDTGIDPDLVGWWQFENDANDSAGGNDGTVYGAVYTSGKIGQAISFDEIDDYVIIPDFDYTNASDEFTISFWFKISDVAGSLYQYMFSHGNVNANNSLNVYFSETDEGTGGEEVRTKIVLGNGTTWYAVSAPTFADGAWHLYTITVSSLDGVVIYIDENPVLTNPAVKGASFNPTTGIYIGGRCDLNADRFYGNPSIDDGLIDDVRLYNRVLSAAEVATLAAASGA